MTETSEHPGPDRGPAVLVTLALHCKPGTAALVLAGLIPGALLTREEPGNVRFDVFRVQHEPDRLVIFEHWKDRASLEEHWTRPYTQEAIRLFDEHLLAPLEEGRDVLYLEDVVG